MSRDVLTHDIVEEERYELREVPTYRFQTNRREFVQVIGAGLVVSMVAAPAFGQRGFLRRRRPTTKISDRLHVGTDGVVTILTGKVEVGQGAQTEIAMAAAEELHVPLDKVNVVMADTERCPNDGGTYGSRTTPATIPQVRAAAAAAHEILVDLAAKRWNVDPARLRAEAGRIAGTGPSQEVRYEELLADEEAVASLERVPDEDVELTAVEDWRVLGTPTLKKGAEAVVTGQTQYPSDIRRPGMLYGKVLRPASYGAELLSVDLREAESMDGVTVIKDEGFVGCAAATSYLAEKAMETIRNLAKWSEPDHPSSDELFENLKRNANPRSRSSGSETVGERLESSDRRLSATYTMAYVQHAPMEPRAAVAEWSDGKLTVWTGTQNPMRVKAELVRAFRLDNDRVRVIVPNTGGGFGGKHTGEAAVEAARLAKAAGQPVSIRWTREEEFTWAYFRPAAIVELEGGLDRGGRLVAWDHGMYNGGSSAIGTPYKVDSERTTSFSCQAPLRAGSYRALASTTNNFAREAFMDELAEAAGREPLEFRLAHLPSGRIRDVLTAAAERFDWKARSANPQENRGIGVACGTEKNSVVAACVEVEVDPQTGAVRVVHVCQAFECGAIHNPANLKSQVEGCIVMGLGGALREEIRFANGRVTNGSFAEYLVPRMEDLPEMDVVLVNRPDLPSAGAGETPIIAVAPAIANAVFAATGKRVRKMPISS